MAPADVDAANDICLDRFTFFRDERGIFSVWRDLARQYGVKGKSGHDARLVAAMIRHGLQHLLTFNVSDFHRYKEIELLDVRSTPAS
jgi:predicted nucleic acid-binding protein